MSLARFIIENTEKVVSDWEQFARSCLPAAREMDLTDRRDHILGMLKAIAVDLETPQTTREQAEKAKGKGDESAEEDTPANAHGTDRAAIGYTPAQMVSEFRALRASILRHWSLAPRKVNEKTFRADLDEVTRFNEAIDQLLAVSLARYGQDVERSKDVFLGVVGHDLRNPLGAIMMSASAMLAIEGPEWPHLRKASRILNSCTRMDRIIGDLMDVTRVRLGDGGLAIVRAPMDLEAICQQAADEIMAFHPECTVTLEASGSLSGNWDSGRVGQLVSNLIANAYEHGTQGAAIEVTVRGEPRNVKLLVHNQGPLIPRSKLADIFNPFRQLELAAGKTRAKGSVGLGLYIAQAIVAAHDGTIEVESTSKGNTFTVCLPRSAASPAAAPVERRSGKKRG